MPKPQPGHTHASHAPASSPSPMNLISLSERFAHELNLTPDDVEMDVDDGEDEELIIIPITSPPPTPDNTDRVATDTHTLDSGLVSIPTTRDSGAVEKNLYKASSKSKSNPKPRSKPSRASKLLSAKAKANPPPPSRPPTSKVSEFKDLSRRQRREGRAALSATTHKPPPNPCDTKPSTFRVPVPVRDDLGLEGTVPTPMPAERSAHSLEPDALPLHHPMSESTLKVKPPLTSPTSEVPNSHFEKVMLRQSKRERRREHRALAIAADQLVDSPPPPNPYTHPFAFRVPGGDDSGAQDATTTPIPTDTSAHSLFPSADSLVPYTDPSSHLKRKRPSTSPTSSTPPTPKIPKFLKAPKVPKAPKFPKAHKIDKRSHRRRFLTTAAGEVSPYTNPSAFSVAGGPDLYTADTALDTQDTTPTPLSLRRHAERLSFKFARLPTRPIPVRSKVAEYSVPLEKWEFARLDAEERLEEAMREAVARLGYLGGAGGPGEASKPEESAEWGGLREEEEEEEEDGALDGLGVALGVLGRSRARDRWIEEEDDHEGMEVDGTGGGDEEAGGESDEDEVGASMPERMCMLSPPDLHRAKTLVLDMLGWGVTPEYLVSTGVSPGTIRRICGDLGLRMPRNLVSDGGVGGVGGYGVGGYDNFGVYDQDYHREQYRDQWGGGGSGTMPDVRYADGGVSREGLGVGVSASMEMVVG